MESRQHIESLVSSIRRMSLGLSRPVLVAIDGPSGSGKSTLATLIAEQMNAVLVAGDDFFSAEITDLEWERRTPEERARDAIDWRRLRSEALEPLLAGKRAEWHPFEFAAGVRSDGTYPMSEDVVVREPAPVIILDGAFSARPELAHLLDFRVLVTAPAEVRHRRLAEREEQEFLAKWHQRWGEAEAYYFSRVCPESSFDIVLRTDLR